MASIVLEGLQPLRFPPPAASAVWGNRVVLEPGFHLFHAPSGRGKTSLLSAIRGLEGICSGRVLLEGFAQGLRAFSVVDQGLSCLPGLSARDNLRLGLPGQDLDQSRATRIAGDLGIAGCLEKPCSALSRGELQRLMALRVLLQESAWILLDEPCAHLDSASASSLLELFFREAQAGRSVIMTSLDPGLESWPAGRRSSIREWSLA